MLPSILMGSTIRGSSPSGSPAPRLQVPGLSDGQSAAVSACLAGSTSADVRAAKLAAFSAMLGQQPDLAVDVIGAMARMVDASNDAALRKQKLEALPRLLAASPRLTAPQVDAIGAFVNESTSIEGRRLKLEGMEKLLRARPDATPAFIGGVARTVNAASDLAGRRPRMEAAIAMLGWKPTPPDDALLRMAAFVGASSNTEVRKRKTQALEALGKAQPITLDGVEAIAAFVDESTSAEGRIVKAQTVAELVRVDPKLSADQVREVAKFVNESPEIYGRKVKCQTVREIFRLRADPPAALLATIGRYVLEAAGRSRQERTAQVERLLQDIPDLSGEALAQGVAERQGASSEADALSRLEARVAEGQARELLAKETAPAVGAAASEPMAVLKEVANQPMVRLAHRAARVADRQLNHYAALQAADRDTLFGQEKELHDRLVTQEEAKRSPLVVAAVGGFLAAGALASMFAPVSLPAIRVAGLFATAIAGLVGAPIVANKLVFRHVPDVVDKRMRTALDAARQYWDGRSQTLRRLDAEVQAAALQHVAQAAPTAPGGKPQVHVGDDAVVIGRIRVERRQGEEE